MAGRGRWCPFLRAARMVPRAVHDVAEVGPRAGPLLPTRPHRRLERAGPRALPVARQSPRDRLPRRRRRRPCSRCRALARTGALPRHARRQPERGRSQRRHRRHGGRQCGAERRARRPDPGAAARRAPRAPAPLERTRRHLEPAPAPAPPRVRTALLPRAAPALELAAHAQAGARRDALEHAPHRERARARRRRPAHQARRPRPGLLPPASASAAAARPSRC